MQQPFKECLRSFFLRMSKYILRISFFYDIPLIHKNNMVGNGSCKLHFMCNNCHRHSSQGYLFHN